jgi:diguanylate cyclase (GGDEF)-like protein
LHDPLTGLPNRAHVMHRFAEAIAEIRAQGSEAALIFIDLDHFKNVNDTLGHDSGDLLLVEVAKRLRKVTRGVDLVARLGGDEFLILMAARQIRPEVSRLRARIMKTVSQPFMLGTRELRVTASLGVSLYPQDGIDLESLLRKADMAMYTAKDRGRNDLAYFEQSMATDMEARTELEEDLKRALESQEFELHYQPRVNVDSGRVVGAEALVRWRHPTRGLLGPDTFIPLCESTGLIHLLGVAVFRQATSQRAAWARAGHALSISVNLSPRQLSLASLPDELAKVLSSLGCDAQGVELEITESLLMGSDPTAVDALRRIHALGMSIALDDFGTGFSNLAYLQRFPITTLKIDKTFIQGIAADRPLAEMIVAMSRLMRLKVVAEGVETAEQLAWVKEQGIEEFQGYLFSPPVPADQFLELLARSRQAGFGESSESSAARA